MHACMLAACRHVCVRACVRARACACARVCVCVCVCTCVRVWCQGSGRARFFPPARLPSEQGVLKQVLVRRVAVEHFARRQARPCRDDRPDPLTLAPGLRLHSGLGRAIQAAQVTLGIGHGALGMGHGAWGIWALGPYHARMSLNCSMHRVEIERPVWMFPSVQSLPLPFFARVGLSSHRSMTRRSRFVPGSSSNSRSSVSARGKANSESSSNMTFMPRSTAGLLSG